MVKQELKQPLPWRRDSRNLQSAPELCAETGQGRRTLAQGRVPGAAARRAPRTRDGLRESQAGQVGSPGSSSGLPWDLRAAELGQA